MSLGGKREGAGRKRTNNVECPIPIDNDILADLRHYATVAHLSQVNAHNILMKSGLKVENLKLKRRKK